MPGGPDSNTASPVVYKLSKPPKLEDALKEDRTHYDDCTPCRILGSTAFIGLGAYVYLSGQYQLRKQQRLIEKSRLGVGPRRTMINIMAMGLVGLGIYRFKN